jgi:integrase
MQTYPDGGKLADYKLVQTQALRHHYQVVRPDGLPDIPLTIFVNEQKNWLADSSIAVYVREVLMFFTWASADRISVQNGWSSLGPPPAVRNLIRQYLSVEAKCQLMGRPDTNGLKVTFIRENSGGKINVRILLAALKRFYETLITSGIYRAANPLLHEDADRLGEEIRGRYRRAVLELEGRPPMPAVSGVDPPSGFRLSANYFRLLQKEWIPKTIDDPGFPSAVYRAGKKYGWRLREFCIVRTLFEAGCRVSEALSLTALDWAHSHFMNRFTALNKGSHGLRTKQLMVSMATAKLYRRYFDSHEEGRRLHDPSALTVRELSRLLKEDRQQLAAIPLFLTERGTRMTQKLFRDYYWRPALRSAGIDADVHLTRHWFVTNALRQIERSAGNEADLLRRRSELIEYMKWRSGERTLRAYEHVQREARFLNKLSLIHRQMNKRETDFEREPTQASAELAYLLGEDDDSR